MDFAEKVLAWYNENKRDLPWRHTADPYCIMVSEVMLQQTQVDRVIPYYHRWLESFPTKEALADADKREVLELWSGLGYNNRALRLQKAAQMLAGKKFPETKEELLKLPGVGPYTANAILAFAFNKEVAVIDTNIRRILIHEFDLDEDVSEDQLRELALDLVPKGRAREWYNALMDFGAMELTARKTGISPISKQSKFRGSTREVRGRLLKHLLKEDEISYNHAKERFPHKKFDEIVDKMVDEQIIQKEEDRLFIG